MKWVLIIGFITGCAFSLAWHGENDPIRKKKYKFIAISIWVALLISANL